MFVIRGQLLLIWVIFEFVTFCGEDLRQLAKSQFQRRRIIEIQHGRVAWCRKDGFSGIQ